MFSTVSDCNIEGNDLADQRLDKDLHGTASEPKDQVEGGLLLDVVVREHPIILKLLASEDKTLLVCWDPFLVLDLLFDVLNQVGWFNIKGDGLAHQVSYKNLHCYSV